MWEFGFTPQSGEQGILDLTGVGQSLGEFHASSPLLESLRGATGVPPSPVPKGEGEASASESALRSGAP